MHIPSATFFYGLDTDMNHVFYAGDRIIALMLHPSEYHGEQQYVIIQSSFYQATMQRNLKENDDYGQHLIEPTEHLNGEAGMFSKDFQQLIRDYIHSPSLELSNRIVESYPTLRGPFFADEMEVAPLTLTQEGFHAFTKHQESIVDDLIEYHHGYIANDVGVEYLDYAQIFLDYNTFTKLFLLKTGFKNIMVNNNPL